MIAQLSPRHQQKDVESSKPEELHMQKMHTTSQMKIGSIFSSDLLVESDDKKISSKPSKHATSFSKKRQNSKALYSNQTISDEKSSLERCLTPLSESTRSSYLFGLNIAEEAMVEAKKVGSDKR